MKEIFLRLTNARFELLMVENPYTHFLGHGHLCPFALQALCDPGVCENEHGCRRIENGGSVV